MRRYVFIAMGPCGETEEVVVKFKSHSGVQQGQLAKVTVISREDLCHT